jgi:Phage integrase family
MRVKHLRRCDVDLVKKLLHVRRSKNETSHRVIPLNTSALNALERMCERADMLGHVEPEHYLWAACQGGNIDPTRPMLKWDTAWRALRDAAGLHGLRFHDLRHTVITELAEMGVADHVLESITGHLSRRMLEHDSHIRINAKRQALDALDAQRGRVLPSNDNRNGNGNGDGSEAQDAEIEAVVEMPEGVTSQSRHSLTLSRSPPSGKLLIPFERRDVRVVDGARLENDSGEAH